MDNSNSRVQYLFWLLFRYVVLVPSTHKYSNAPLVYVIVQVTHPVAPPITNHEESALKRALSEHVPLATSETVTHMEVTGSLDGATPPNTEVRNERILRFKSRDRRTSVTYASNAVTVETTRYDTWQQLRELASLSLAARMDVAPVDGVERIGLRYIDELRVPDAVDPLWREWVDPQLAPPALEVSPGILHPHQQQSVVQYRTDQPGIFVVLRYGAANGPSAVQGLPIDRPTPPPSGPFFLIDTDASWTPLPGEEVPPLTPDSVLSTADALHDYVKELFEASLTDRLRTEVLDAK